MPTCKQPTGTGQTSCTRSIVSTASVSLSRAGLTTNCITKRIILACHRVVGRREREVLKQAKALHNEELAEQIKLEKAQGAHEEALASLEQLDLDREKLAVELAELEQRDTVLRYEVPLM